MADSNSVSALRRLWSRATARLPRLGGFGERVEVALFGLVIGAVVVTGYVQGQLVFVLPIPSVFGGDAVTVLQATVACLTLTGLFGLSMLVLLGQLGRDDQTELPTTGPSVTAVVPVHGDESVLHRSVVSLLQGRYRDLSVVIVAEPDDEASIRRGRALARHDQVELLVNGNPGTKAGAIDYAAAETTSELLAVFDADERVDPRFVSSAVARIDDDRADVVQGRTIPEPEGLTGLAAYYESVVLGDLSQRLLTALTGFTVAASRTVVMRRSAFDAVDGYDPKMLTEDYAFAFDCYCSEVDVAEQFSFASTIEAAHNPVDWWGQRKRWMTGYAQVLHRLVGRGLRRLWSGEGTHRDVLAPAICASSVFGNVFMLSLLPKAAVLVAHGQGRWLALPGFTLIGAALALRVYDTTRGRLGSIGVGYLLLPAVLPLYSLAGIKAVVEYLFTWNGEWYSVSKGS